MIKFTRNITGFLTALSLVLSISNEALAAKKKGGKGAFAGGSISAGLGLSLGTAEQNGINAMKTAENSSASALSSATEYVGYVTFHFSGNFVAIQLRPTLFSQSSSGTGTQGADSYSLNGYTIFPLVRITPLSNDLIDFYIQGGLGYGKLDGSVKTGNARADFSGSAFGTQIGLGAQFCFVPDHCFNIEGNYRYLPISRNIVTSASGGLPAGTTQATVDKELEDASNNDVATTLSGVSGILSYTYNF